MAIAWLREYYRRPGVRMLRVVGGPLLLVLGVLMQSGGEPFSRIMGIGALGLGVWWTLKPLFTVSVLTRRRRQQGRAEVEIAVTLGGDGVRVEDGKTKTELPWERVSAAGESDRYVWLELRGGTRMVIPRRAIDDPEALRELLAERSEWKG
jgi:hypothetical protein